MDDILREFLLETHENLVQLDLDLVGLEKSPDETELLARVFRTLHTVKGTAGFLGLLKLQEVAHAGENLLSRLRAREMAFNPEIATALLGVVDAIRAILGSLEATEKEGSGDFTQLVQTLERLLQPSKVTLAPSPPFEVVKVIEPKPEPKPEPVVAMGPAATVIVPPQDIAEVTSAVAETSIRVDVGLLDTLMNLVGELVLVRNQLLQLGEGGDRFLVPVNQLNRLTSELQAGVMKTRMQPIGQVLGKFPRVVRDLAVACGKKVRLVLEGQETELDKSILEAIRDPLTHMVRNAVDHGIEPVAERLSRGKTDEGTVLLRASHEGGKVIIELRDDGGGIHAQKVRDKALAAGLITPEQAGRMTQREMLDLIFLPGFSTTDRVTQFSGRGVGMDVVRTNICKIGGSVELESEPGHGTTVRLSIPLTLAIIPALIVSGGGERYAIPQANLLELLHVDGNAARGAIETVHDAEVYRLRGALLPLVRLTAVLGLAGTRRTADVSIVVLQAEERTFGLIVDAVHDTEEIVVKPLPRLLQSSGAFSGATLMGDGSVSLILDIPGLAQRVGLSARRRELNATAETLKTDGTSENQPVLLCCAVSEEQVALPLSRITRLEEFPCGALERTGGKAVVQYRGEVLPLLEVNRLLGAAEKREAAPRPTLQVVVVASEGRQVGLVIDEILDIVQGSVQSRAELPRPGVMYSGIVANRVTEVLDIESIIRRLAVPYE